MTEGAVETGWRGSSRVGQRQEPGTRGWAEERTGGGDVVADAVAVAVADADADADGE